MPLLNESDLAQMRAWRLPCGSCGAELRRNYCRQCDEFFVFGHTPTCSAGEQLPHAEHRTYDSPKPTGKAPEDIVLTGYLFPWADGQPVFLRMPFSPHRYLPVFPTVKKLRKFCRELGAEYQSIKRVDVGVEFLASVPREVLVITGIRIEPGGRVRFVQVLRD